MDMMSLLIQAVSGAAGGNVGAMINKATKGNPMLTTILGAIGGVGGGQLLGGPLAGVMGNATGGDVGAAAIVGAILPMVVGMLKKKA